MKRLQIVLLLLPPVLLAIPIGVTVRRYRATTDYLLSRYPHDAAFDDAVQSHLHGEKPRGNKISFMATWFADGDSGWRMVCKVDNKGQVCTVRDVYNWAQQNSRFWTLTLSKKKALKLALRNLPPNSLPLEKDDLLLLTFYGSNGWKTRVYDRAHVPPEVKRIYLITGAFLEIKNAKRSAAFAAPLQDAARLRSG